MCIISDLEEQNIGELSEEAVRICTAWYRRLSCSGTKPMLVEFLGKSYGLNKRTVASLQPGEYLSSEALHFALNRLRQLAGFGPYLLPAENVACSMQSPARGEAPCSSSEPGPPPQQQRVTYIPCFLNGNHWALVVVSVGGG